MDNDVGLAGIIRVLRKTLVNIGVEITDNSFPQAEANRVCG